MINKKTVLIDARVLLAAVNSKLGRRGIIMKKINLIGLSAADILQKTGQENSVPVNLNKILKELGISAISTDFSNLEEIMSQELQKLGPILGASLTTKEGDTAIFYSSNPELMSDHRYRFTVAHELGHLCINGCKNHVEFRHAAMADDKNERTANIFAGELLIPLVQLERVSSELLLPTPKNLATIFEVSETVMFARLKHLNRQDLYI